jgi:hypothetical protein
MTRAAGAYRAIVTSLPLRAKSSAPKGLEDHHLPVDRPGPVVAQTSAARHARDCDGVAETRIAKRFASSPVVRRRPRHRGLSRRRPRVRVPSLPFLRLPLARAKCGRSRPRPWIPVWPGFGPNVLAGKRASLVAPVLGFLDLAVQRRKRRYAERSCLRGGHGLRCATPRSCLWPKRFFGPSRASHPSANASPLPLSLIVLRGRTGLDRRRARSRLKAGAAGVSVDGVRGLSSAGRLLDASFTAP